MKSNIRPSTLNSKSRRLSKRKHAPSMSLNEYRDKKRAALMLLMNLYIVTQGKVHLLTSSMMKKELASMAPEIEVPPKDVEYNTGIVLLGYNNFLSAAVTFCHDVAREGRMTIVSVGCGDGSIEKKIAKTYRERYGEHSSDLNIILVDPDPRYKVHFKYVDELVEKRRDIIGHCALFIIWPVPQPQNDGYDIEAIRQLQPHGVLTVYESGGSSGSEDYVKFLLGGPDLLKMPSSELGVTNLNSIAFDITEECESHGLDNYEIDEIAVNKKYRGQFAGTIAFRMAIARRVDFHFVNVCPAINWTCKREELEFRKFMTSRMGAGASLRSLRELDLESRLERNSYVMQFNMISLGFA